MKCGITINSEIISELSGQKEQIEQTEQTGQYGAVNLAVGQLRRDIKKTLSESDLPGLSIRLVRRSAKPECYILEREGGSLTIGADSTLGFLYGIYEVSRSFLGVHDFWFWNDQVFVKRDCIQVPEQFRFASEPFRVKLRGWFVNDEVLIHKWSVGGDTQEPWRMVFEALLRCGGNMVIPGTDSNAKAYRQLASCMGLSITHHHAEPLGAAMFARAYPGLKASYAEHGALFRMLWQEGIEAQKDMSVIWNLGFRGQGDRPFWEEDPRYETDEARGALIGDLIRIQYEMVKAARPDAVCCTNLYGETMELYQKGYLKLPEDVIHIWADNGFGKMVSRRQENHNPRVPALPEKGVLGRHGIYYHVSFYDLQAANHITMLPNSARFVEQELRSVLDHGADDYWLVNCSNVKPHVYYLTLIAGLWKSGCADWDWAERYIAQTYGPDHQKEISECFQSFSKYAVAYGPHEDDHAGEQFANHVPRILMTQFMTDRQQSAKALYWAAPAKTLREQVLWYETLCEQAVGSYGVYLTDCSKAAAKLSGQEKVLFEDSLLLQVTLLAGCYEGAWNVCKSLRCGFDGDYKKAFYYAGRAGEQYVKADQSMRDREHGKWHGFYGNECLTDVKQSALIAQTLMAYFRVLGDGPHFYEWQREFLHSEADRRVMLILNMENHVTHMELYELMKARWEDEV